MSKHFILMVEDHYELASTLCEFLEEHDFVVDHARNLNAARQLLKQQRYHILLLDINLPDGSGYELCEWLRHEEGLDLPVLMLTARDTLDDKLKGFEVSSSRLQIHDLILDPARQQLTRAGQSIELPPIQFKLLKLLMRHSPKVLTKQEIMMELWGDAEPESDALRSHIYNLRKMVDKPFEQKLIHTISGVGLKIALEA